MPCVNGPFEYFRNQMGEKITLNALKRLTPVFSLQKKMEHAVYNHLLSRVEIFYSNVQFYMQSIHMFMVCFSTGFRTKLRRWGSYEWCADRTTDITEN